MTVKKSPSPENAVSSPNARFSGSIPEHYDEHLGPFFFDYYAAEMGRRVSALAGGRVLETASGTAISTEGLRATLPESVGIVATDLNQAMVDYAEGKRGHLVNVEYRQADALALPFADGEFGAVICQFGIMFFPDKAAGMREAARVLKPDGQFLFSVWDSFEVNTIAGLVHDTVGSFFESDPPQFMRAPFATYEIDPVKEMLAEAGFTHIAAEVVPTTVECPSAHHLAIGMVKGNPTIHELDERGTADPETVIEAVAGAFREAFGDAPLRAPLQAIFFDARRA